MDPIHLVTTFQHGATRWLNEYQANLDQITHYLPGTFYGRANWLTLLDAGVPVFCQVVGNLDGRMPSTYPLVRQDRAPDSEFFGITLDKAGKIGGTTKKAGVVDHVRFASFGYFPYEHSETPGTSLWVGTEVGDSGVFNSTASGRIKVGVFMDSDMIFLDSVR